MLFPALDVNIMLTQMGEDATMLAVWGVYRPPFGALGAGLDRVVMRRVAEATIRTFAHRIGAAITNPTASPAPGKAVPVWTRFRYGQAPTGSSQMNRVPPGTGSITTSTPIWAALARRVDS